jgi:hypothetical protein
MQKPSPGTAQYSREGNGWRMRHFPKASYIDLGWNVPYGIEPKIKGKMKRIYTKRRQRKSLKTELNIETF